MGAANAEQTDERHVVLRIGVNLEALLEGHVSLRSWWGMMAGRASMDVRAANI
jgi:hypothetical protein